MQPTRNANIQTEEVEMWERQEDSTMWNPTEEGMTLQGEVMAITEGLYGKQYSIFDLRKKEELKTPSHKVLQSRMQKIKVGDVVRITYLGQEPPSVKGQNPTKIYEVDRRK